jgi:hypothetical protein
MYILTQQACFESFEVRFSCAQVELDGWLNVARVNVAEKGQRPRFQDGVAF